LCTVPRCIGFDLLLVITLFLSKDEVRMAPFFVLEGRRCPLTRRLPVLFLVGIQSLPLFQKKRTACLSNLVEFRSRKEKVLSPTVDTRSAVVAYSIIHAGRLGENRTRKPSLNEKSKEGLSAVKGKLGTSTQYNGRQDSGASGRGQKISWNTKQKFGQVEHWCATWNNFTGSYSPLALLFW
jgi:hypothetical protein